MRILHLSDIHYRDSDGQAVTRIVAAACADLQKLVQSDGPIDLIVFSGDLTYSGTSVDSFISAYNATVSLIAKAAQVPDNNVILAPGNHDVDREVAIEDDEIVESGLRSRLSNRETLSKFVRDNAEKGLGGVFLNRLKPFYDFVTTRNLPSIIYRDPFVEVHRFRFDDLVYSFALLNSAWRSTGEGESERKRLLVSDTAVLTAIDASRGSDITGAVLHHPFEWLNEYDRHSVEPTILSSFDLIMHGHIHNSFPEGRVHALGSSLISQAGCLYQSQEYTNSYQIIEILPEKRKSVIHIRTWYDLPRAAFDRSLRHNETGSLELPFTPRSMSKQSSTQQISLLCRGVVYKRADEHISMTNDEEEHFHEVFVCPPLTRRPSPAETSDITKKTIGTHEEKKL